MSKEFCPVYNYIKARNMSALGQNKLMSLWLCAIDSFINTPGSYAEAGVAYGGSLYLLAHIALPDRKLYAFDSFGGLPEYSSQDCANGNKPPDPAGQWNISLAKVKGYMGNISSDIIFIPGWFKDTLVDDCVAAKETFAFVHLDVDLYDSYKLCYNFFLPRMYNGGIVVIDEYGFLPYPGCKKAFEEFFSDNKAVAYEPFFHHGEQHAFKIYKR